MKKSLARLLRRWAFALHPETPNELPPGYETLEVNAVYVYPDYYSIFDPDDIGREAEIPEKLWATIGRKMANAGAITYTREQEACPAARDYLIATAYVGVKKK